jgi:hypothetical protein
MAKFKISDKVRIRPDTNSQFRGRIGTIEKLPNEYANVNGYMVKIELQGFTPTCQVLEKDIEAISDK